MRFSSSSQNALHGVQFMERVKEYGIYSTTRPQNEIHAWRATASLTAGCCILFLIQCKMIDCRGTDIQAMWAQTSQFFTEIPPQVCTVKMQCMSICTIYKLVERGFCETAHNAKIGFCVFFGKRLMKSISCRSNIRQFITDYNRIVVRICYVLTRKCSGRVIH